MPDNTTLKVRLKDPATSNYLYPATGLNAIYAGTSGDAATLSIIDGSSKIYARYLQIVDTDTSKVASSYLPITFTSAGLIASASLGIFDGNGKISPELLPSYVDDVVEIPVLTQVPPYPAGNLYILDNGDGTYNFYQKNASNEWVPGGGNSGTIYVASNGDIYRCIAGASYPDPDAAKISQSPYVIDQSVTSGVQLVLNNGTLSAQGIVATTTSAGVVKVSEAATNGASLTVAADGTIAAVATVATYSTPGTVVVAGTTADYNAAKATHADSYIVPSVKFMYDYVDEYVPSVDFATTGTPGIVRIDPAGHITVGDSGVIAVPAADADTYGVVKILNQVNTTIDGNATKAVTQAGIVAYVGSALNGYQSSLIQGDGIDITERTISTRIQAPIAFDGGKMTVSDATAASPGAVLITGDSSYISAASATLNDHPLAVNPKAVHDYVTDIIGDMPVTVPIAKDNERGGFKTSGTSTALVMTSAANATSADVLAVNAVAPLTINSNNQLTALPASAGGLGVVQMQSLATASSTDSAYTVPRAYDVKDYVDSAIATVDVGPAPYVTNKTDTNASRGTIRVVRGSGIGIYEDTTTNPYTNTGNIYLTPATSAAIGGIIVSDELTGLDIDGAGHLKVSADLPLYIDPSNNKLSISAATINSAGVVKTTPYNYTDGTFSSNANVPTGAAVSSFVVERLAVTLSSYQEKIAPGTGLKFGDSELTSNTLSVDFTGPIYMSSSTVAPITSKLSVSAAVAGSQTVLNNTAFGAVWVRHNIRAAATIEQDARVDATVPSEKAVRELVDAIPYITYEQLP